MLDLTRGGRCLSGLNAVGEDIDIEAKTPEFCEQYDCALNRLRYEVRKSVSVPPKVIKAKYRGHQNCYRCGNCGFDLVASDLATYKFCPNCGREILHEKPAPSNDKLEEGEKP